MPMENVVLFGASSVGEALYKLYKNIKNILYFCDNNEEKWNKFFCDLKVISPAELKKIDNLKVIITSTYYNEITEQLLNMGITNFEIYSPFLLDYNLGIMAYPLDKSYISNENRKDYRMGEMINSYSWDEYNLYSINENDVEENILNICMQEEEKEFFLDKFRKYLSEFNINDCKIDSNNLEYLGILPDNNIQLKNRDTFIRLNKKDIVYLLENDKDLFLIFILSLHETKKVTIFDDIYSLFVTIYKLNISSKESLINFFEKKINCGKLSFVFKAHYNCFLAALKGKSTLYHIEFT